MFSFDILELLALGAAISITWILYGIVWRLYLSPLAAFPGPKFAALTLWYECYFDIANGGGNYIWRIQEMHEKYGPIVRTNPYELSIKDPSFYDQIYASAPHQRNKWSFWTKSPESDNATGFTVEHALHRLRRDAIAPFFSKRKTMLLEPQILAKIEKLCCRLDEYAKEERPVNLTVASLALAMDVLTEYSFERSFDLLDEDDFNVKWKDTVLSIMQALVVVRHFKWFAWLVGLLPEAVARIILPDVSQLRDWKLRIRGQVREVLSYTNNYAKSNREKTTLFEALCDSDKLPAEEKSLDRLADEGSILLIAGSETPGKVLALIYFYLLANPCKLKRLRDELRKVMPSPDAIPSQSKLEQLPYLVAIVHEGLRMHSGVVGRSHRLAPEPLKYGKWTIPAHTPMSMAFPFMHYDPAIFPEPHTFLPERWLQKTPEGEKFDQDLKKYLVAFGRGTRICLGYNLGYAVLFLSIAVVIAKFDMELFETGEDAVRLERDWTIPMQRIGVQGVRVTVKRRF